MPLDSHCARVLKLLRVVAPSQDIPTPAERRQELEDLAEMAAGEPMPAQVEDIPATADGPPVGLRAYAPPGAGDACLPAMLYFHGGGGVAGSLNTHDCVCRALAVAGDLRVIAVDYRLAPEHPFPAAVDDALASARWVAAHAERLKIDPNLLVLAGDSAGGGLAAVTAAQLAEAGDVSIARLLLICPILDIGGDHPSRAEFAEGFFLSRAVMEADTRDYVGPTGDLADPRISPLKAETLKGLPPTHLHLAAFDPFRDEGLAYAWRLGADGAEALVTVHPGMIHYFYALPRLIPYAREALAMIGRELGEALG